MVEHKIKIQIKPPAIINLSVVRGMCPSNCIHCPLGKASPNLRKDKFGKGFMEIKLFKDICEQAREFNPKPFVRIHGVGEPALWPSLKQALQSARLNKIKTWVFTTGLGCDDFLETFSYADIVEFSINSRSPLDFKKTKGLDEPEFLEISNRIKSLKNARVLVSRVESADKKEDEEFVKHWKPFVHDAFIRSFHDYSERIEDKGGLLLGKSSKECLVPENRMNIDGVLGIAVRCFNELFDPPMIVMSKSIANIREEKIKVIWEGKILDEWRRNTFLYPACSKCRSCQPLNPNTSEKQLKVR